MNFQPILTYLQDNYVMLLTTIPTYLAAGGGVSGALEFVKRLRKWERTSWILFMLGTFSVLASAADFILQNKDGSAIPTVFGNMAPKLVVAALVMHRIAVNPLSKLIEQRIQAAITKRATVVANSVSVTGVITPHATVPSPLHDEEQNVI